MKKRKKIRDFLLLLGINLLVLLLLEIFCWIVVPQDKHAINFESVPDYVYRLPPNGAWEGEIFPDEVTTDAFFVNYRTNERGFRGPAFPDQKTPGRLRVICMGDSHTYGEGVEESETYPSRLEQVLNRATGNRRFEVINMGVPGYSSCQGLLLLEKEVRNLSPDYVVMAYGSNDYYTELLGRYRDLTDREVLELLNRSNRLPDILSETVQKTHLYHGIKKGILYVWSKLKGPAERGEMRRVPVKEYRENLRRFHEFAEKGDFTVIYMNIANFRNTYSQAIGEVAHQVGGPFINAVEVFRRRLPAVRSGRLYASLLSPYREMLGEDLDKEIYDEGALYYTVDGAHPNAVGQRIIAEELARIILAKESIDPPKGILPPPP